jgi:hypothetical protein
MSLVSKKSKGNEMNQEQPAPLTDQENELQAQRAAYENDVQVRVAESNGKLSVRMLGKIGLGRDAATVEGVTKDDANKMNDAYDKEHFHATVDYKLPVSPVGGFPNSKLIGQNLGVYKPVDKMETFQSVVPASSREEAEDKTLTRFHTYAPSDSKQPIVTIDGKSMPLSKFVAPAIERKKLELSGKK